MDFKDIKEGDVLEVIVKEGTYFIKETQSDGHGRTYWRGYYNGLELVNLSKEKKFKIHELRKIIGTVKALQVDVRKPEVESFDIGDDDRNLLIKKDVVQSYEKLWRK